jgi:hypothetical protein
MDPQAAVLFPACPRSTGSGRKTMQYLLVKYLLEWLVEQRGGVAITLAVILFAITLILRYGFDVWWPWGIGMATVLGFVGLLAGNSK